MSFRDTAAVRRTGRRDPAGRALWRLSEGLLYHSAALQCWLLFPEGFVTNWSSVPRLPLVYLWCGDRVYEPAGAHDFLYTTHCLLVVVLDEATGRVLSEELRPVDRETSDGLFLEMLLLDDGVDEATAHAMHAAVRLGGESSWLDDTSVQQPEHVQRMIRQPESDAAPALFPDSLAGGPN